MNELFVTGIILGAIFIGHALYLRGVEKKTALRPPTRTRVCR